ncbi:MAG: hypothetical protein M3081_01480 [Gemmatimonadota bacterium]|nr:hypothetical protein [Gemmatimonadota bacterium]
MTARPTRSALAVLAAAVSGCAYFNGIYNARQAEQNGDKFARSGRLGLADSAYTVAAMTAESVLVRYPKSQWTDDALRIAGRGWARARQCNFAVPRLRAYVDRAEQSRQPAKERDRAALALGECLQRLGRNAEARELLAPMSTRTDAIGRSASLWAARAAIATGDDASARLFLAGADTADAEWELAGDALAKHDYSRAESLLVKRAAAGDGRTDADSALAALWRADRISGVERIVAAYDLSRAAPAERARLHVVMGDLFYASGRDSLARAHYLATERLSRDSIAVRESAARLTLLSLRSLSAKVDVDNAVRTAHARAAGSVLQRRLEDNLLLLEMLEQRQDFTGASLFLAAEIARDSLRAPALAHTMFKRVAASSPQSPLAAKALLAAAQMAPDSADSYIARIRREYPLSPYLPAEHPDSIALSRLDAAERPLQDAWTATMIIFGDSIRKLHPPPAVPASTALGATPRKPAGATPAPARTGSMPP